MQDIHFIQFDKKINKTYIIVGKFDYSNHILVWDFNLKGDFFLFLKIFERKNLGLCTNFIAQGKFPPPPQKMFFRYGIPL